MGSRVRGLRVARDRHGAHRADVDDDPFGRGTPGETVPPLQVAVRSPDRRANEIVSETSSVVLHSTTTTCGLTLWNRAMAGLRAES